MKIDNDLKHQCFCCKYCISTVKRVGKYVTSEYKCDKFKKNIANSGNEICTGYAKIDKRCSDR